MGPKGGRTNSVDVEQPSSKLLAAGVGAHDANRLAMNFVGASRTLVEFGFGIGDSPIRQFVGLLFCSLAPKLAGETENVIINIQCMIGWLAEPEPELDLELANEQARL